MYIFDYLNDFIDIWCFGGEKERATYNVNKT